MAWKCCWTLRCDECGAVADTVADTAATTRPWPDWLSGFRVGWGYIAFHVCPACAARGKPAWLIDQMQGGGRFPA